MKKLIWAMAGVSVLLGFGFHMNRSKGRTASPPGAVAETTTEPARNETSAAGPTPEAVAAAEQPSPPVMVSNTARPVGRTCATQVNAALDASLVGRTVELLVSREATSQQKQDAWNQIREAGKLDSVISELEKRTTENPQSAEYPATLGQAYLQKCGTIKDVREQGILAIQADKLFDTALSLDASNWEARFTKAVAMSYWPPMLNKGEEVIEQFQTLIQQQETRPAQPEFVDTYAWLGDQYHKAGRRVDARAIWERGLALFPANEKLQTRLASAP